MQPVTRQGAIKVRETMVFGATVALVLFLTQNWLVTTPTPQLDALHYIDYALNIHDYNVFGSSGAHRNRAPKPGFASSPLYPAFIAGIIRFDPRLAASLRCLLTSRLSKQSTALECGRPFGLFVTAQTLLVVVMMICFWYVTYRITGRSVAAWMAAALCLATTKPTFFANHFLTEIFVLALFTALILAMVLALQEGRRRWWCVAGLVVGLLTLTRPEYQYLSFVMAAAGLAVAVYRKSIRAVLTVMFFVISVNVVIAPWQIRNYAHFGEYKLTGGYSDIILSQRTALNRMSWSEWGAAFVYWLPGYGETIAERYLPVESYRRIGMSPESYIMRDGAEIFERGLAAVGERQLLTGYLIETEILAHPFKHTAVAIPLAWRGILAGKYLAPFGIVALIGLGWWAIRCRTFWVLWLMLPAVTMVGLYAMVSASVPRYNAYMIFYYSVALAWCITLAIDRAQGRRPLPIASAQTEP